ncbi:MAG TPA: AraC family transcriptional regulator [Clostridiales bacterium]|nr:AraC family transcriptional regulator [Clostridiales bacterium]
MTFEHKITGNFEVSMIKQTKWTEMVDPHFHDCYELYYLMQGEVFYFIENGVFSVKKGDMVLIPCHIIHKTRSHNKPGYKRVLISFNEKFVGDMVKDDSDLLNCFHQKVISLTKKEQQICESLLNQLLDEYSGIYKPNKALTKCLLGQLLILLSRHVQSDEAEKNMQTTNIASQKIIEIVEYINREYSNEITLEILSETFYMSPAHLSKLFKKSTGFHYSEYLINVRLRQAVRMLQNTDRNITEIAFETGFNSSNHFCKSFKSVMGVSPLKYRKMSSAFIPDIFNSKTTPIQNTHNIL